MPGFQRTLRLLHGMCLGILGAGHLGRALARGLLREGFPSSQLLLSYRGSPRTRQALEEAGLLPNAVTTEELGRRCRVVCAAVRPQDVESLASCRLGEDAWLISFIAGVPLSRLPAGAAEARRVRVMPSAPYTIEQRDGLAGIFPADNAPAREICQRLGLVPIGLDREEAVHAFTAAGVCLPLALTCWRSLGKEVDETALARLGARHLIADFPSILDWARRAQKTFSTVEAANDFLSAAATRGGVTEAILESIQGGADLVSSLEAGIRRSRALQAGRA